MIAEGCLWNSGIFAWRVGDFLDDVSAHTPEVAPALAAQPGDTQALLRGRHQCVASTSACSNGAHRVAVLRGDFGWDDVGTWAALLRVRALGRIGETHCYGPCTRVRCVRQRGARRGNAQVVLYGVSGLVVVATARLDAGDDGGTRGGSEGSSWTALPAQRGPARVNRSFLRRRPRARLRALRAHPARCVSCVRAPSWFGAGGNSPWASDSHRRSSQRSTWPISTSREPRRSFTAMCPRARSS